MTQQNSCVWLKTDSGEPTQQLSSLWRLVLIREGHTDFYGLTKRILGRKYLDTLLSVVVTKKQQATYPQNTKSNFIVTTFTNKNLSCSS